MPSPAERLKNDSNMAHLAPDASIQQQIADTMRAMLVDGRIQPGERVLEAHVARAFGVSRSPARSALDLLAASKLLWPADGRGFIAAGPDGAPPAPSRLAHLESRPIVPVAGWKRIYEQLDTAISHNVFRCSLRIREERVAEHFAVSRTVARECLSRMHSAGMVRQDRQGRWIAPRVTTQRIRETYAVRALLEPAALSLAAARVPVAQLESPIADLAFTLGRSSTPPPHGRRSHQQLERALHVDLLAHCPNEELVRAIHRAQLFLGCHSFFDLELLNDEAMKGLGEHLDVLQALATGHVERAAGLLREHLEVSCDVWVRKSESVRAPDMALPDYLEAVVSP
jgi:DNA-binding GntR family transcriptional regulator